MRITVSIGAILICFAMATPINAETDVLEQLKDCARTQNNTQRIACYEGLGKAVLSAESAAAASETSLAAETPDAKNPSVTTEDLPDSIGGGKYARDAGIPKEQFTGVIKTCKKSVDNRWFYIFENGQIWKQVRHKTIRHKNCNSSATLTKDGFGYIMRISGEDRRVRVRRHR